VQGRGVILSQLPDPVALRRFVTIVVFDFGRGTPTEMHAAFRCLSGPFRVPQFYDKWMKIDAARDSWTEITRYLNGTSARTRYRYRGGRLQEWVEV
jgi:hypothetical protein